MYFYFNLKALPKNYEVDLYWGFLQHLQLGLQWATIFIKKWE